MGLVNNCQDIGTVTSWFYIRTKNKITVQIIYIAMQLCNTSICLDSIWKKLANFKRNRLLILTIPNLDCWDVPEHFLYRIGRYRDRCTIDNMPFSFWQCNSQILRVHLLKLFYNSDFQWGAWYQKEKEYQNRPYIYAVYRPLLYIRNCLNGSGKTIQFVNIGSPGFVLHIRIWMYQTWSQT